MVRLAVKINLMRQAFKIDRKIFEKIISEMKGNCCINAQRNRKTRRLRQRKVVFDGLPFNFYFKSANERIVLNKIWLAFRKHGTTAMNIFHKSIRVSFLSNKTRTSDRFERIQTIILKTPLEFQIVVLPKGKFWSLYNNMSQFCHKFKK